MEIIIVLCLPLLILWLQNRLPFLQKIGAVVLCYVCGFIFAVLPIRYDKELTQTIASVIVAVAIPLILMSLDLRKVRSLVREFLLGYGAQIISVIVVSVIAYVIAASNGLHFASQLAGMAVGLYTGGTPNLIAIGNALIPFQDAANVIATANAADFLVGGIYYLLLLTIARPVYNRFLGRKMIVAKTPLTVEYSSQSEYDLRFLSKDRKGILKLGGCFLLAIAVLGVGAGIEILINGDLSGSLYLMVSVSLLGLILSFVRPIRRVKGNYQLGQYFVLVFSLGLSMSIDFRVLVETALPTMIFFTLVQLCVVVVHLIFCKLLKIDADTAIITNTAGIYGPPFISPVASALGNRGLIAPGIICGLVGLAIGNLLGIATGMILTLF